ncbi:hypothetical protein ABNF97_14735 [Plantactinospora sp. B6F1]|uniref:hypothetical protein n=1 Tax=Plantactinospora sp. B6F1 TaxID=3158971 RepID=UPI0032D9A54B
MNGRTTPPAGTSALPPARQHRRRHVSVTGRHVSTAAGTPRLPSRSGPPARREGDMIEPDETVGPSGLICHGDDERSKETT